MGYHAPRGCAGSAGAGGSLMPLLLDFESRSRADLKAVGGRNYWQHPSTEALCCVAYDTTDGELLTWTPGDGDTAAAIAKRAAANGWAAHNATGFDRFAMLRLGWTTADAPWIDTSELARTAGLPGALDALATRWLGLAKDKLASAYTKSLSRPSRAKATRGQLPTPDLARVVPYCASDVEIMAHGWPLLEPWLDLEPDVVRVDREINDRGIGVDLQLVDRLLELDARFAEQTLAEIAAELGSTPAEVRDVVGSPQQLAAWTGLPDAQKETIVEALLGDDLSDGARALCRARQATASIARGKLEAMRLRTSPDGRMRDNLRYYGGFPGRWSGVGAQLQNMPRPAKQFEEWTDDDICWLVDHVLAGGGVPDASYVDFLLRACLVPRAGRRIIARDFTGVESRALAWCAGDTLSLDAIAKGLDMYKVDASPIFGVPYASIDKSQRQTGKVATLALGYQGGAQALLNMARKSGIRLPSSPSPTEIVGAWRGAHAPTVRYWYAVQAAFAAAHGGETVELAGFTYEPWPSANGVAIFLPSGRPMVYNDTALTFDERGRPQLSYYGTKKVREHVYGGKLVQNEMEGLCRDLMARAMVAANDAGMPVLLTVHDEIVSEVAANDADDAAIEYDRITTDLPDWAEGFPIAASGFTAKRYRK
jgi:DNA polymerase